MNILTGVNARFQEFSSIEEMIKFISAQTASILAGAIKAGGSASYVAAGGSTVPPLLETLSNYDIGWERVNVTLSDDRWVKPSDPTYGHLIDIEENTMKRFGSHSGIVEWKVCD